MSAKRRWLVLAGVLLVLPLPQATSAFSTAEPVIVTVTAPGSIGQERTVWDVAFDSNTGRINPPVPGHIGVVSAEVTAPSAVRNVHVSPDGPGRFSPTSVTSWPSLAAGQRVTVSWRWTAPLRAENPPDRLTVTATVRYEDDAGQHAVSAQTTVASPPPPPPVHDAYVSDLPYDYVVNGYGPLERDRNNGELSPRDGGPIRLGGVTYAKGLGVHARSTVGLRLAGRCDRFTALVGVDDSRGSAGSVIFRVVADGQVRYDSGVMTGSTAAKPVDIGIAGVDRLSLVAEPTGDGQGGDWADWAEAHVRCGGVAPGTYRLVNAHSGQCLDVQADSREPGAAILQWGCNGGGNQSFRVTASDQGVKVTGLNSGLCLGVALSGTAPGADVIQWTCNTNTSQQWLPVSVGRGRYRMVNGNSGHCLEVAQASLSQGAVVQQWTCNNLAHQSWRLSA